eukprot:scaffold145112_cov30-Tisochrysis_lutea.AAC.4
MLAPDGEGGCKRLFDVAHGLLRRCFLDQCAAKLEVVRGADLHHLLEELSVDRTCLLEEHTKGKAPREIGDHQLRSLAHAHLIRLHREVFEH